MDFGGGLGFDRVKPAVCPPVDLQLSSLQLDHMTGRDLLAAVEDLTLFLPRLSSAHMLNLACPVGVANR